MVLDVVAIVLALALLMAIAYRGLPVIVFAPVVRCWRPGSRAAPLLPSYTETFMAGAAGYIRAFFPLFLLGRDLRQADGDERRGGGDRRGDRPGARAAARDPGRGARLRRADLRRRLAVRGRVRRLPVRRGAVPRGRHPQAAASPAPIALGAFTLTMDALPGSPQIQNLIPTRYFGTDAYAAPGARHASAARWSCSAACSGWSAAAPGRRRPARATATGHRNEPEAEARPTTGRASPLAVLPLVLVLVANFVLSRTAWSVAGWYPEELLKRDFPTANVTAAAPTWALIVALLLGIAATLALDAAAAAGPARGLALGGDVGGAAGDLQHGVGGRLRQRRSRRCRASASIQDGVLGVSRHVLVSEAVAVNVLAGITGSASGGLSIALEVMGAHYLELARAQGISPELLHRIASMASGGMDTLPAQRRRDHPAGDHRTDPPAVLPRHLRDHGPQDRRRLRPRRGLLARGMIASCGLVEGRVAWWPGAAPGIGREIARTLATCRRST